MKNILLCSLVSCMLLGQIKAGDDNFLISTVLPSAIGASGGALYTLAKAYYAHRTYAVEENILRYGNQTPNLAKTLAFGAELGEFNPQEVFLPKPYIHPLILNTVFGAALAGGVGIGCGFFKNNIGAGCEIAVGNILSFAAISISSCLLGDKLSKRQRYENGYYVATRFVTVRPENPQNPTNVIGTLASYFR